MIKMGRLVHLTILGILAALLGQSSLSDACSCALEHPQTKFCRADFVALVRVKHLSRVNDYEVAYKVKLHRIFKATPEARVVLKRRPLWLWSSSVESMCGVSSLNPGQTWVISGRMIGGKLSTSLCGLAMLWSKVTPRQRKGFSKFYHRGCSCKISYTEWWRKGAIFETSGGKQCLWESSPGPQNCQESYGICMRGDAGCSWVPTLEYNKCIMQHQRHRVKQQARNT